MRQGIRHGYQCDQEVYVCRQWAHKRALRLFFGGDVKEDAVTEMSAYRSLFGVADLYDESLVDEAISLVDLDPLGGISAPIRRLTVHRIRVRNAE